MTEVLPEIEIIEAHDFGVPCKPASGDCGREAEWVWVKACCGEVIFFCSPCKDHALKEVAARAGIEWMCKCIFCHKSNVPLGPRSITRL